MNGLFSIVTVFPNGGMNMNSFSKEISALKEAYKLLCTIKENNIKNIHVFLSEPEYDTKRDVITGDLVNEDSLILFKGNSYTPSGNPDMHISKTIAYFQEVYEELLDSYNRKKERGFSSEYDWDELQAYKMVLSAMGSI